MFFSSSDTPDFSLRTWHFFRGSENTAPPPPPGGPYRKNHCFAFCKMVLKSKSLRYKFFRKFFFVGNCALFSRFFFAFFDDFFGFKANERSIRPIFIEVGPRRAVCTSLHECVQKSRKIRKSAGLSPAIELHTCPKNDLILGAQTGSFYWF